MELIGHTNAFRFIGDMLHLLSVIVVLHKMLNLKTSSGISLKSQLAYAIVFTTRYIPTLFRHTSVWMHTAASPPHHAFPHRCTSFA